MAGIEPASERLEPRTSTSVVGLVCRWQPSEGQNWLQASRLSPKALFRADRGVPCGTPALWRLILLPAGGRNRQAWPGLRGHVHPI